jgi:putative endonuclease
VYWVYILSNKKNGTLYIGQTKDLTRRIWEHKTEAVEGFTKKYGLKTLVYHERHDDYDHALAREKKLKKWRREWKIKTITEFNPDWKDLYEEICK